jgi:hypothetical protein
MLAFAVILEFSTTVKKSPHSDAGKRSYTGSLAWPAQA